MERKESERTSSHPSPIFVFFALFVAKKRRWPRKNSWPRLARQLSLALSLGWAAALGAAQPDVVIANFEGENYGGWTVTGEAFGTQPAPGTLPNQMEVSGFEGRGLVNSFHGGDDSQGTLTSPPFKIERPYLNFLIGGGAHEGQTCVNLLVDGEIVRTATGPNDQSGGSERLDWHSWDVGTLQGTEAVIEIVDRRTGGWGHINVDSITLSERRRQTGPASREFEIQYSYLHLPVQNGAGKQRMKFVVEGRTVREFDIELAMGDPDFLVPADVRDFRGVTLRVEVDRLPADSRALEGIRLSDELPAAEQLYEEPHRPQFHFTSRYGWLNDPNGLVYSKGEWHLYYQHNPYGWNWGNMHWGHAVSPDLVHWRELPEALYPQRYGDWAFSGSALVDWNNTGGFKTGGEDVLVAAYTSTGRGECLVYSNDRGRTWIEYTGNPVVKHRGRDPKVIWHEPTQRWVMALYTEDEGKQWIAFHTSANLKDWKFESRVEGFYECPDLFELPLAGDAAGSQWVLYAADGKYVLGEFDGRVFRQQSGKHQVWFGDFYAAQSYSDAPDGRRVQIGWGRGITFPGHRFNQQMTVPVDLTLRPTPEGPRMFANPVPELNALRTARHHWSDLRLKSEAKELTDVRHDLLDLEVELEVGDAKSVGLELRGTVVAYEPGTHTLRCGKHAAPMPAPDGRIKLRVLVDRGSVEVFGQDGRVAMSTGVIHPETNLSCQVFARGGSATVADLTVHELKSIWK